MAKNKRSEERVTSPGGGVFARLDIDRAGRCGTPEAVFALKKTPEETVAIADVLVKKQGHALVTRADEKTLSLLKRRFRKNIVISHRAGAAIAGKIPAKRRKLGIVAIAAAGTSDLPIVEEAAMTLESLGIISQVHADIGIAGIHRLFNRLDELSQASAIITVAGMEGALPSVLAGLVPAPVIAVPTSVGYGASFGGISALLGMLNSCSPGITVVNIDNGFGAAVAASRMLGMMERKQGQSS